VDIVAGQQDELGQIRERLGFVVAKVTTGLRLGRFFELCRSTMCRQHRHTTTMKASTPTTAPPRASVRAVLAGNAYLRSPGPFDLMLQVDHVDLSMRSR